MGWTSGGRVVLLTMVWVALVSMAPDSVVSEFMSDIIDGRVMAGFISPYSPSTTTQALSVANTIHPNGSWSDIDYRRGCGVKRAIWPATEHLDRVLVMTKAWAAPQSTAHLDPVLLAKILVGLDWWLVRDYSGESCTDTHDPSDCCGMTGMWHPNWWWNMVGVPLRIGPTCLLLRSAQPAVLTPTRRVGCSTILRRSDWRGATGANTLWLAQGAVWEGLLRDDQAKVAAAYGASAREARYSPGSEDGVKRDGSFLQHSGVLYTGGYGYIPECRVQHTSWC